MGAKRGLKIVVGTVPAFIVAAFIEGFITRHTEIPDAIRLSIIIISLAFVIFYYVLWPWMLNKDRSRKNLRNLMNTKENIINTK
jgi:biotin transporter BioY